MAEINIDEGITLRYVNAFKCIGGDCPDTCCQKWGIAVGRDVYEKLQKVLPQKVLEAGLKRNSDDQAEEYDHARIAMNENGYCPFLDRSDDLCSIHKQFGEQYLGQTCQVYPRQYAVIDKRCEKSLSLSCPEAARLCLLTPGAADKVWFDHSYISDVKPIAAHYQPAEPESPYDATLDVIREVIDKIFNNASYPMDSRIVIATWFAERVSGFVNASAETINTDIISQAIIELITQNRQEQLHTGFLELQMPKIFPESVLVKFFLSYANDENIALNLMKKIFWNYGEEYLLSNDENGHIDITRLLDQPYRIFEMYQERKAILLSKYGARLNLYFENYCKNFFFRHLFIHYQSPLYYLQLLALRVAALKFMLFGHPDLNVLIDEESLDNSLLDNVAVEVFYNFARGIEHSPDAMETIVQGFTNEGVEGFDSIVMLMKF